MNFSNELNKKTLYSNVKYQTITTSGLFSSHQNIKEVRQYLSSRNEPTIATQGRFGIVGITDGSGKASLSGTKKFESLLSSVKFN